MADPQKNAPADILIVDDTPANLRLLSDMLQEQGYNVRKAINGKMALLAIQTMIPDLILLDVNMPDINGYEVCEKLRMEEKNHNTPVIFISALNETLDKVKAFQVGGTDYITKPFAFEEVLARVKHQLQLRQLNEELRDRNQELQDTLLKLKVTQSQLVQQEKMSGLASLVAGVAHEINNPISFIYSNLIPANEYIENLLDTISFYQKQYPAAIDNPENPLEDFEFIKSDLTNLMKSMYTGADRIRSIVLALRIFSHLDEADIKTVEISRELDSTLQVLEHRLKQHNLEQNNLEARKATPIHIVKKYHDIPKIICFAKELNQVFLHLLNNAIDALEAAPEQHEPTIWLEIKKKESEEGDRIQIIIKDNGIGISEEARSRLFEPFFTTKPVGKARGLGLSISYQIIVDKHKGSLDYESSEQGTTFIIEIPATRKDLEILL
ncbi:response regulator [Spirulina sp. 06S082]|uniref:hybrid sensor histidine kinase/response regulator n=1 Tax=Spirulina sp. 06S082 TaxID=3110248 RepID=UPI002B1EC4B3|nr:response regulator [Spirulina sp. 06S082]MEA5470515.1 response regulator [Spirulina sp. 06S082]